MDLLLLEVLLSLLLLGARLREQVRQNARGAALSLTRHSFWTAYRHGLVWRKSHTRNALLGRFAPMGKELLGVADGLRLLIRADIIVDVAFRHVIRKGVDPLVLRS